MSHIDRIEPRPDVVRMPPHEVAQRIESALAWMAMSGADCTGKRFLSACKSGGDDAPADHDAMFVAVLSNGRYVPCVDVGGAHAFLSTDGASEGPGDDNEWASDIREDLLAERMASFGITEQLVAASPWPYVLHGTARVSRRYMTNRRGAFDTYVHVAVGLDRNGAAKQLSAQVAIRVGDSYIDYATKSPSAGFARIARDALVRQLDRRYRWTVELSLSPDRHGIDLDTDAEGARAFLAQRDAPATSRRAPLVHWVREHFRRRRGRTSESGVELVRQHMRGVAIGTFAGLHFRVRPSRYELDVARGRYAEVER